MRLEFAPEHRIDLETAKARARAFLITQPLDRRNRRVPVTASRVAEAIWPGNPMQPQGAGGAASRILKHLAKEDLACWTCITHSNGSKSWGWTV
jgi:hypothetical protein